MLSDIKYDTNAQVVDQYLKRILCIIGQKPDVPKLAGYMLVFFGTSLII